MAEIAKVESNIAEVGNKIDDVERKITEVENRIIEFERLINAEQSPSEKEILRKEKGRLHIKEDQLRKEKKQLRKEKGQLRKEKEQLRDELRVEHDSKWVVDQRSEDGYAVPVAKKRIKGSDSANIAFPQLFTLAESISKTGSLFGKPEATVNIGRKKVMGQVVPNERIFVRESYVALYNRVWHELVENRESVVVTGTPGIGKSLFGILLVIELIHFLQTKSDLHDLLFYEHATTEGGPSIFYIIDVKRKTVTLQRSCLKELFTAGESTFLVKDGPCPNVDAECPTLMLTSPRGQSLSKKIPISPLFFLSPWTYDELIACWRAGCAPKNLFRLPQTDVGQAARSAAFDVSATLDDEEAILRRWSADLGPVPRRVFNPVTGYFEQKAALDDLGEADLRLLISISRGSPTSRKFHFSHQLLLMSPSDDSTIYELIPSSVAIGRKILQKMLTSEIDAAKRLMGKMSGVHLGLVFEPYAHFVLSTGGRFSLRNLKNGDSKQLVLNRATTVDVPNTDLMKLQPEEDKYYIPTDPTFAVIDSWDKKAMYQITVCDSHPIKSTSKQFVALRGKVPACIIFVVPASLAAGFKEQPLVLSNGNKPSAPPQGGWNNVEQFVLGLEC